MMTRTEEEEFERLAERASVAIDGLVSMLTVPPMLAVLAARWKAKIDSGMPREQARGELAHDIRHLGSDYPFLAESLNEIADSLPA
jgi:hypothetical protein